MSAPDLAIAWTVVACYATLLAMTAAICRSLGRSWDHPIALVTAWQAIFVLGDAVYSVIAGDFGPGEYDRFDLVVGGVVASLTLWATLHVVAWFAFELMAGDRGSGVASDRSSIGSSLLLKTTSWALVAGFLTTSVVSVHILTSSGNGIYEIWARRNLIFSDGGGFLLVALQVFRYAVIAWLAVRWAGGVAVRPVVVVGLIVAALGFELISNSRSGIVFGFALPLVILYHAYRRRISFRLLVVLATVLFLVVGVGYRTVARDQFFRANERESVGEVLASNLLNLPKFLWGGFDATAFDGPVDIVAKYGDEKDRLDGRTIADGLGAPIPTQVWKSKPAGGANDQYTSEHYPVFYGEVEAEYSATMPGEYFMNFGRFGAPLAGLVLAAFLLLAARMRSSPSPLFLVAYGIFVGRVFSLLRSDTFVFTSQVTVSLAALGIVGAIAAFPTWRPRVVISVQRFVRRLTEAVRSNEDQRAGFRPDIQGLRAVAVILVLLYHAGVPAISGGFVGVDVFFVISGYLITGVLLRELHRSGRISLLRFYGRRARRLLPASLTVTAATALLALMFLPRSRWADTGSDMLWSAAYGINWRLAEGAVDYGDQGRIPSVMQHYWSLAVEEQFYLVWPWLLLAMAWLAARHSWRANRSIVIGMLIVTVSSLVWSAHLSLAEPDRAYFVSSTRAWELGIGGLLATWGGAGRLPRWLGTTLLWGGIAAIVVAAAAVSLDRPFPGLIALLPTLGTAAVIAGGSARGVRHGIAVLANRPMLWVGQISYSLYLWHWPLLVVATHAYGALSISMGIAVVSFAVIPAWATHRLIEEPFRRMTSRGRSRLKNVRLAAACTTGCVAAGLALHLASQSSRSEFALATPADALGARVLGPVPATSTAGLAVDQVASISPDPANPAVGGDRCEAELTSDRMRTCSFGDDRAEQSIALIGDSHAGQWIPAFKSLATKHGWHVTTYIRQLCPLAGDVEFQDGSAVNRRCSAWNKQVRREVLDKARPDLVVFSSIDRVVYESGNPLGIVESTAALAASLKATYQEFSGAGIPVAVIRDSPRPGLHVPDCVVTHPSKLSKCAVPRSEATGVGKAQVEAVSGLGDVELIDLNDAICPSDPCPAVIGSVLVYMDSNHLSAPYVESLAPRIEPTLLALLVGGGTAATHTP